LIPSLARYNVLWEGQLLLVTFHSSNDNLIPIMFTPSFRIGCQSVLKIDFEASLESAEELKA